MMIISKEKDIEPLKSRYSHYKFELTEEHIEAIRDGKLLFSELEEFSLQITLTDSEHKQRGRYGNLYCDYQGQAQ